MTIEAGRGLAALAVVLFHAGGSIFPAAKYWHSDLFVQVFGWGYAGVFFFFALSGFIIAQVHARDVGQPRRLRRHLGRRLARIYPVYWLVLAGFVAWIVSVRLGQIVTLAWLALDTVTTRLLPEVGRELAFGATAGLTIAALVALERRPTRST